MFIKKLIIYIDKRGFFIKKIEMFTKKILKCDKKISFLFMAVNSSIGDYINLDEFQRLSKISQDCLYNTYLLFHKNIEI